MDLKNKSESLAKKMNKITEKFSDNLDLADELVLTGDDVLESVQEKTQDVALYSSDMLPAEIINLDNLISDFKYVRETLKENTENGRKVLNVVTEELLDFDAEKKAGLIMSFAELNKAMADNMKLYIIAYKEISRTLLNLDSIKGNNNPKDKSTESPKDITPVSTTDLIKRLSENE